MNSWLNGEDVPWSVMRVGGNYEHINPAFFREFGYSLSDIQHNPFEALWQAPRERIIDGLNVCIERTNRCQIAALEVIHPRHRVRQVIRGAIWHEIVGETRYRHTVLFSQAAPQIASRAIEFTRSLKIIAK